MLALAALLIFIAGIAPAADPACDRAPSGLLSPTMLDYCRGVANGDIVDVNSLPLPIDKEEEERKVRARLEKGYIDPGAVSLCRPPHHMTARDGCQ